SARPSTSPSRSRSRLAKLSSPRSAPLRPPPNRPPSSPAPAWPSARSVNGSGILPSSDLGEIDPVRHALDARAQLGRIQVCAQPRVAIDRPLRVAFELAVEPHLPEHRAQVAAVARVRRLAYKPTAHGSGRNEVSPKNISAPLALIAFTPGSGTSETASKLSPGW